MNISTTLGTAIAAIALSPLALHAADIYETDLGHTEVRFSWSHAGVSIQHGEFTQMEGVLSLDEENLSASTLSATIDATSVSSGFGPLDDDILSANFLDVETYPEITFVSTGLTQTGEKTADVTGDLTLHGVTKPITMAANVTHLGPHPLGQFLDYYKGNWAGFTASFEIDPSDYGVGAAIPVGALSIEITTEMKAR